MKTTVDQNNGLLLLQQWNLSQYSLNLEKNNYPSVMSWHTLTLSQLIQFGFKTGHAKRFIKNVNHITFNKNSISTTKETNCSNTTVVLLGETGVGKSTLIQSIDAFISGCEFDDVDYTKKSFAKNNADSQTQDCHIHTLSLKNLNINNNNDNKFGHLTLIDTPGIGDTSGINKDGENIDKIMKCLLSNKISNNSVNVFAFLIQRGTNRATTKLKYIVNQLKCYLPQSAINHFAVILTRSSVEFFVLARMRRSRS